MKDEEADTHSNPVKTEARSAISECAIE